MGPKPREAPGMACSACYYLVISSTHLSNGHFRRVKGVFKGPLCPTSSSYSPERAERALGCSVEDLKALFYCELCHKQYLRHQEFDNHINSYDHAHKQRLKELKHREFARNVASKSWKDQRKQEKALRRLHQLAQLQQDTQRVPGRPFGLRSSGRAVSQQQDRDMDQRDHSPEDTPQSFNHTQRHLSAQASTAPLSKLPEDLYHSPSQIQVATARAESPLITHPAVNADSPAVNPQARFGLYPQLPLPGQEGVGGRLGVSFCFSRRGPRLEPSASVFSDLEEEEREKREQMKERIKGIMEDIDKEIGEVEQRKHSESDKLKSSPDRVESSDLVAIPRGTTREQEEIEKIDVVKELSHISTAAPDNHSPDSLYLQSQTQVSVWGAAFAGTHVDTERADSETERKQEAAEGGREESRYMCVMGKDGSTCLRWPVSSLKLTKSRPHICYSCNPLCLSPRQPDQLTEDQQESQPSQPRALSGESDPRVPAILTPVAHACLQRQTTQELSAHRQEKAEGYFKAQQHVGVETEEHLFLKNQNLSSSEVKAEAERCTPTVEECGRAASHPFDPAHSDSSDTNSVNPMGGRLRGAGGIRERAITALSCKSESVIHPGTQRMCISPSRCECGSETMCKCTNAPQPGVGVSEVSRKKRRAGTKKHKLGKRKRREKEKVPNKQQSAKRKVRSVVSTVSAGREARGGGGEGEGWGKKRRQGGAGETRMRRRRVQRAGSSCLQGRCEAEPVSVSVRKRRPHRSHSAESQSQAEHCSGPPPLSRHTADRGTIGEARPDRDAVTFPWRSHFSLHSFSPGCNSKLFWERGHHSNPRSFIDCCYPDNSCGCSPARKRKLLHRDRKFIHRKRKSLRRPEVWEETEREGRKMGWHSGFRDRGLISDAEQWEWMRGSCPGGWRSRNRAAEWDRLARFSPSPGSWDRRSRHLSTEDVDWDRCSMDRWTWGSSDSWEDRGTHRSTSGSGTGADSRDSPDCAWGYAGTRHSSSKPFSSPEWWTSRQTCSPQSVSNTRASRCHSPRSCSPCSTSMSELSWEWSRSSTCSGVTGEGLTGSSGRTSSAAPGLSSEAPQEAKKQGSAASPPSGLNCSSFSHSSSHGRSFAPAAEGLGTLHCDRGAPQIKEPTSQSDLGQGPSASVTASRSGANPGLSPGKAGPQKPPRMLHLPLIGKLPAIQRSARRKKRLLEKSQVKDGEDEEEAKSSGGNPAAFVNSQKCPQDMAESNRSGTPNLCLSQIRTDDKQTGGETAPPISFTAEEMDKYRLLQEQAREHMQKVLEQTQESADTRAESSYARPAQADGGGTSEERYTPAALHNPPQPRPVHTDTMQTQAQHALQVSLPLPHVTPQESFTPPLALSVPSLPPLPPSPPLSSLHHIILQHTALSMPPSSSSSSSTTSPSPAIHPHPAPLPHALAHLHPSLHHHLHLSPFTISSLFPSILLSHHPIPLLPQSHAFHAAPLAPLSPLALQPLNPQPFIDRAWPVRFQQKAL